MTDYNVRKINKKKCGNKLTQEMFETLQQVFDNMQDVTCSISEVEIENAVEIEKKFEENKK